MTTDSQTKEKTTEQNSVYKEWLNNLCVNHIKFIAITFVIALLCFVVRTDMIFVDGPTWGFWSWFTYFILLLLVAALFYLIRRHEGITVGKGTSKNEKLALLIQNSCHGRMTDIIYVLAFLLFLDWLPNITMSYVNGGVIGWRILVYIAGLAILVFGKPTIISTKSSNQTERTVLVTGFSNISIKKDGTSNCDPFFMPFDEFPNIKTVVILMTNSLNNRDQYDGDLDANTINGKAKKLLEDLSNGVNQEEAIRAYIKGGIQTKDHYKDRADDIEIIFSKDVNYNSFKECNDESDKIIKEVIRDSKCSDKNIVINISPGTSIVSSVMALNSIKGERLLAYVPQGDTKDTKLCFDETPNAYLVQFNDIINERN